MWDKDEYERQALERIVEEEMSALDAKRKEAPVARELLKPRDYKASVTPRLTLPTN